MIETNDKGENINNDINEKIIDERKTLNEIETEKNEIVENLNDNMNIEAREIDQNLQEKEELEKRLKEERKEMIEKAIKDRHEVEKRIDIKLQGFEEFLENRKVTNVAKNSYALYNVNWFNVCCGFEKLDDSFEEEVQKQIIDMGIVIDESEIKENLLRLFEEKRELINFKRMIKNRLISCSEIEPPAFFEKLFTNSFGTFKPCDKRAPQSLLYLYDDYRTFLEKDIFLTKLDRVLILIYCETRQHHLSKYISLEIIRRENDSKRKKNIISLLDKLMSSDKSIIRHNEKLLEQQTKLKYEQYKRQKLEEERERNNIKNMVSENNIILQKNKLGKLVEEREEKIEETREIAIKRNNENPGFLSRIIDIFENNKSSPVFELTLTPKEREAYQKSVQKMKGGMSVSNDNLIKYGVTNESKNALCNKIKGEKNIYKEQMDMVNNCFN